VKIVIAKEIAKKTNKNVKTIQNKIGNAINCYKKFVAPSDASYFTMRELNGQGAETKFDAKKIAARYAKNTKAQRQALINALQAIL